MANCGLKNEPPYKTQPIANDARWNNAKTVMRTLLGAGLGLKDYMAAGIVGNMWMESQMNPTAYRSTDSGEGQSGGLCQWHDTVNGNGRFTNLKNYADSIGKTWQDIGAQTNFLIKELKGKYGSVLSALLETSNEEESATVFCQKYEVAGACAKGKKPTDRIYKAKDVLQKWRQEN